MTRARRAGAGIAFFDFDNTLIDGDAGPLFGLYLFFWRRRQLAGHFWRRFRLWLRYVPYLTWMGVQAALYKLRARRRSSLLRAAYKGLRGVPTQEFYGLMEEFAREAVVPRLLPDMVRELRGHLEAGRECVVVTTGMEDLVRGVVHAVDPAIEVIGCRLRERKGRLTGRTDGPLFGLDKANIMHAYARAKQVRMDACWAYSDHWSDKHMLEAVGHPVAVNPRGQLKRRARKAGWAVLHAEPAPPPAPGA